MKKQSIAIILFLAMAFTAAAQDTVTTMVSKNRYVNIDFGVGYLHTDLSNINSFLSAYGYKPVSEDFITLSFSPSFFVNGFVFRGEYTWQLRAMTQQSENIRSSFGGRHTAVSVGYVIVQRPGFRLYPYIGINAFTSQLMVREKTSASSLDGLVNNQQRTFHLVYSNTSLDVGFQFDKLISLKNRKWDCPQNARFMTLGLRVGYLYGPGSVKGRFNGSVIDDAPTYSPNGPYLKLVLGFSTKMRDLKWKK